MQSRSWRWLKGRILALLSTDSRTARHFAPTVTPTDPEEAAGC